MKSAKYLNPIGPAHLLILISVVALAVLLAYFCRRSAPAARFIRYSLATILAVNALAWYVFAIRVEGLRFPSGLPFDLCDVTLWITVFAAVTLNPVAFDIVYYTVLAGTSMALLTPDLWAPLLTFPTISFFIAHGLAVATVLTMVWGRIAAPRRGSFWRVFLLLNAFAAAIGAFDAVFKTNYMYLRQKPAAASLFNIFGPWPFYLIPAEVTALLLFYLLWLPFRQQRTNHVAGGRFPASSPQP